MTDKLLTFDEILAADDLKIEKVAAPEWGGHFFVRNLLGDQRDALDESIQTKGSVIGVRAQLVASCFCDEAGKFANPSDAQILALGRKSAAPLDRAFDVCQRLNHMNKRDAETLEKNSHGEDANGSGSA